MAKNKKNPPQEGISQTLQRLDMEESGEDLLGGVVSEHDDTNTVSSFEEEEPDETPTPVQVQVQPPRSPLRQALFERPPVVAREPAPAPAPEPEEPAFLPEVPSNVLPMMGNPRLAKKAKPDASPGVSAKKFGASLAKKLPGAEKVKVRKRLDDGSLGYVGEYGSGDLGSCSDVETFLHKYVKPKFGSGEYHLQAVDAGGNTMDLTPVRLLEPPTQTTENASVGLLRDIMAEVRAKEEKLSQQQSPVSALRDVMALQKEIAPPPPPPDNTMASVFAAMSQSQTNMMQMFMQMQQQNTQMMVAMMQKRDEPTSSQPLPPPPPPPPELPWDKILAAAQMMLPLLRPADTTTPLLMHMLDEAKKEKLTPRDTLELIKEMRPPPTNGSEDFRKSIENMSLVMQVAQNLRGINQEPQGTGFFDAIGALFTNPDFVGSIGTFIKKGAESAQMKAQVQARKELAATHVQTQRALSQVAAQHPTSAPPPANVPAEVRQAIPATPPAVEAAASIPVPPQQQVVQLPPLPEDIAEHVNKMIEADDKAPPDARGDQIQATIDMFKYLASFGEWQSLVQRVLMAVHSGDRQTALHALSWVFRGFVQMNLLPWKKAESIFEAFEVNFDKMVKFVRGEAESIAPPDPRVDPFGAALAEPPPEEEGDEEESEEDDADEEEGGEEESEEDEPETEEGSDESSLLPTI